MSILKSWLLGCVGLAGLAGCAEKVTIDPNQLNQSCSSPPDPVRFVLLGKQGQNLAAGTSPQVQVTFEENGQPQAIACAVGRLQSIGPDTTRKYSGIGIGCDMGGYSVRQPNAIKSFRVMVGGQLAGSIDYDLQKNGSASKDNCYSVKAFRFNNLAVRIDSTVMPFVAVLHTNL